ncbi:MAG: TIGR00282 family metallophosphoesterase [bacterium]
MRILFIGDVVGKLGRQCVRSILPKLASTLKPTYIIANGENAAGGFGIDESSAEELFSAGVHLITSGNHIWDKKEIVQHITKEERIMRPLNYPPGVPGHGSFILRGDGKPALAVLNAMGRVFMPALDCPFRTTQQEIEKLKQDTDLVIVDFHAEATSEKIAFGYYFDGKVSAVIGTHTHVQTADEKILPKGTAYITDVGMTGPVYSVIGVEVDQVIGKFLTMMPRKFDTAKGDGLLCGAVIDINEKNGQATAIQRLQLTYP